jgi:phosphoribosylformimino-5-aminoimidazole carboxamide ribotide isomerase
MGLRVIPVLDLRGGQVVRAVGGRRQEYRPLTPLSRPLDVARAFRDHFGLTEIYVADLDALAGAPPDLATVAALAGDGFRLWLDAGVRERDDVRPLVEAGVRAVVVGLETVAGPAELAAIVAEQGERIVFSLDLRGAEPLGDRSAWNGADAGTIANWAIRLGVRRLLVLDLARVGSGGGTGTEELCAFLAGKYPEVEVSAGGGVRGPEDLGRLRAAGVRAALVATALHDGRLTRADVDTLSGA